MQPLKCRSQLSQKYDYKGRNQRDRRHLCPVYQEEISNRMEEHCPRRDIHRRVRPLCLGHICKAGGRNKVALFSVRCSELNPPWGCERRGGLRCSRVRGAAFTHTFVGFKRASVGIKWPRSTSSFAAGARKEGGRVEELSWTPCCGWRQLQEERLRLSSGIIHALLPSSGRLHSRSF